jgi:phosphoenolpyruvate-protein kinase (PTS system EI component)
MLLKGFPYFPGTARGPVQGPGGAPGSIALIDQAGIEAVPDQVAGIIVVDGAPFSHAMIGLRTRGVPIVIIDRAEATQLVSGMDIEIHGGTGGLQSVSTQEPMATPDSPPPRTGPPVTADGTAITLRASIRAAEGAATARELGAAAIGLVRSEFLGPMMAERIPDNGVFLEVLRAVCEAAAPLAVDVRLVDIAPDKRPGWLPAIPGADSPLGLQGARLYDTPTVGAVIDAQLRALAELAIEFDLGIVVPYLSDVGELRRWSEHIRAAAPGARRLVAMAETPAAVLDIPHWLDHVDAVSVGCNDLMQCLFAADRDLAVLRDFLDPHAPVLYRFLDAAARDAGDALGRVQLCGLLPQLPGIMPVLIGLGFRAFSVDPKILPYLAREIQAIRLDTARELAAAVLAAPDARHACALIQESHRRHPAP